MPNFESTGPDGVPNFWLNQFDALHNHCSQAFNKLIQGEEVMDERLTKDNTFHILRSKETQLPHKYCEDE